MKVGEGVPRQRRHATIRPEASLTAPAVFPVEAAYGAARGAVRQNRSHEPITPRSMPANRTAGLRSPIHLPTGSPSAPRDHNLLSAQLDRPCRCTPTPRARSNPAPLPARIETLRAVTPAPRDLPRASCGRSSCSPRTAQSSLQRLCIRPPHPAAASSAAARVGCFPAGSHHESAVSRSPDSPPHRQSASARRAPRPERRPIVAAHPSRQAVRANSASQASRTPASAAA